MKIVIVSTFYSEGMGYTENCLPKALAALGHDVQILTSNLNVYGNEQGYDKTYASFLGPADQGVGEFKVDGYTVHRLPSRIIFGYVYITNLYKKIKALSPDIVHSTEVASFHTYSLALLKLLFKYKLFAETHQHMSVIKTYLKIRKGNMLKRIIYKLTRTLPSNLASRGIEKCYAIAPDCADVASVYYGVPRNKITIQSLGTDTDLFRPALSDFELKIKSEQREDLGYSDKDVVCVYTGRFSEDKNPLMLAKAIKQLVALDLPYYGLFIGEGIQKDQIEKYPNIRVLSFMKHKDLADYYRIADIAIWPTQESMSMLDAAACGLPLIVSDKIGDLARVEGNGQIYKEGNIEDLRYVLASLIEKSDRRKYGEVGRNKMVNYYSWGKIAEQIQKDYNLALSE